MLYPLEEMNRRGQGACFELRAGLMFGIRFGACYESPETAEYVSSNTQIDAEAAQGFSATAVTARSDSRFGPCQEASTFPAACQRRGVDSRRSGGRFR